MRELLEKEPLTRDALSIPQSADALGISVASLRRIVRRREIPHHRLGRRVILLRTDVAAFLRAHRVETAVNGRTSSGRTPAARLERR